MLMYRGPRQSLGVALVAVPHFGVVDTPFFCGIQDILPSPAFLPVLLFCLPTATHLHIASRAARGSATWIRHPRSFFSCTQIRRNLALHHIGLRQGWHWIVSTMVEVRDQRLRGYNGSKSRRSGGVRSGWRCILLPCLTFAAVCGVSQLARWKLFGDAG